jgi:hypothetical protein
LKYSSKASVYHRKDFDRSPQKKNAAATVASKNNKIEPRGRMSFSA